RAGAGRGQLGVELVGLGSPGGHDLVEAGAEGGCRPGRGAGPHGTGPPGGSGPQPEPEFGGLPGKDGEPVPERAFGAGAVRVDGAGAAYYMIVDAVLRIRRDRGSAVQPGEVGLVIAEQQLRAGPVRCGGGGEFQGAEERVVDGDRPLAR